MLLIKKIIISMSIALALAGCYPSPPVQQSYPLPDEMKHCKVYKLNDGYREIRTVYCPKEPTTTSYIESCGKSCTRTVTTSVVHEE